MVKDLWPIGSQPASSRPHLVRRLPRGRCRDQSLTAPAATRPATRADAIGTNERSVPPSPLPTGEPDREGGPDCDGDVPVALGDPPPGDGEPTADRGDRRCVRANNATC